MRIDHLDGLRGVAILLVLVFHAYSRWPSIVPYGDAYEMFPVFRLGWLGVQLFFLISGFVIFMTLDQTENLKVFIYKRWIRLFPAMLIASILIYLTTPIFSERPAGEPQILDLLPGLTFIEPIWWSTLLDLHVVSLEGAFWSLYVEVKFYIIAGFIYYVFGRNFLIPCLLILFGFSILTANFYSYNNIFVFDLLQKTSGHLSLLHFGWFAAGATFYLYYQTKMERWFVYAIIISILSSYSVLLLNSIFIANLSIYPAIGALLISGLFAASLKSVPFQNILNNSALLFFGFISYPLYLIHENTLISMITKMPVFFPWLPVFSYPFIPIAVLSLVAYFIANKYELTFRKKLTAFLHPDKKTPNT